ncbi:MAG: ATP-binding protein [Anaerolineae bacterium]
MTAQEILRLFLRRGAFFYDEVAVEGSSLADLDREGFESYITAHYGTDLLDQMSLDRLLINMKLARQEGTETLLTVAGVLLFGRHPQRLLPYARISAVSFEGTELDEGGILLSQEIEGRLDQMIEQAGVFLARNNFVTSEMQGWRRVDRPQYHRDALREAVVNAVAHRDYSITTSQTRIFAFADRIEVRSPGRLPNTVTLDNIRVGLHAARNPVLYTHLTQMGYMKRVGIGIPTLVRLSRELSGRDPHFELVGEELRLTIWARLPGNLQQQQS